MVCQASYKKLCVVGPWFKMWFKGVELSKKGVIVLGSALDCTRAAIERNYDQAYTDAFEPKNHNRAHATYSHVFRVSLAAIANLPLPWDIGVVTCDRAQTS